LKVSTDSYFDNVSAESATPAAAIRAARKAALSDPEGQSLAAEIAKSPAALPKAQHQIATVPTGCQHCADPPCMQVCPTTATGQRADGIVTIDYDLCIGCAYCAVACPYEARFKVDKPKFAFGEEASISEQLRYDEKKIGVATKCTFCADRIDAGVAAGLVPGRDPEATPVCVNSCISGALVFGDIEDPNSEVARLLAENNSFRMHEEAGTSPGFYYLWDRKAL
jgi:phenylacetyl-CoA:acceptor oxidoreductase subunit 1